MDVRPALSIRSPAAWYENLSDAVATCRVAGHSRALIKHFVAGPSTIDQPPLNEHVVALHLGGPKRVQRWQGRRSWVKDVALGSMTLMPAYQANRWRTSGPIEFAHLTLGIGMVEQIITEEFDREPATHQLHETIGAEDPLLEQVFRALLEQLKRKPVSQLHMDALLTVFVVSLLERHSTLGLCEAGIVRRPGQRRGGLAGWQLRRVVDHMHGHMHEDTALRALAELTGLSRAHFFRAFRQSTGRSPGQVLAGIRMRHAMMLLKTSPLHIEDIATAVGFHDLRHFASAFTKRVGVSPRLFRTSLQ